MGINDDHGRMSRRDFLTTASTTLVGSSILAAGLTSPAAAAAGPITPPGTEGFKTGITQANVAAAPPYREALEAMKEWMYAFGDSLFGYSPLGVLFGSGSTAALVRYSVVFVLAYALTATGMYLLARQLGCRPLAAAVAAAAYAYAPWHLSQDGHLNVLSIGGIPLSVALLLRSESPA